MKYTIVLIILFTVSCKSQHTKLLEELNNQSPAYQIKLPAYHINNGEVEKSVINSILNSSRFEDLQIVIFNKKEYSIKDAKKILDTIGNKYSFDLKMDSLTNRKLIIIKKSTY